MKESQSQVPDKEQVVIDVAKSSFSDLWKKEDYWAIWLSFLILAIGLVIFVTRPPANMNEDFAKFNGIMKQEAARAPFKTIAWHEASEAKKKIRVSDQPFAKSMKAFFAAPGDWSTNPLDAPYISAAAAEAKNKAAMPKYEASKAAAAAALEAAKASEAAAVAAGFSDAALNDKAKADIAAWQKAAAAASKAKAKTAHKGYNRFGSLAGLAVVLAIFFGIGAQIMGKSFGKFFAGFFFVFIIAVLAYTAEVQQTMKTYGFGFPLWAIVLTCTYWFGQRVLNFPSKTLNITISADMSVCGVSAAIATASACRAKKEELTLAVGLSMVFTAIMMVAMPAFIKAVGMPDVLGGAWIGGTIDAAGAFLGDRALYVAATVKMIQNVLIGIIAFAVAVYWCARVDRIPGTRVSSMEIWHRFPKFVLGFIAASIVFSIIDGQMGKDVSGAIIDQGVLRSFSRLLREWFFVLAFASIGLATNFRELAKYFKGGKPLILYVCGQSFNLALTLAMAYVIFYLVFPEITARI